MQFSDLLTALEPTLIRRHSLSAQAQRNPVLKTIAPLEAAPPHALSYLESPKYAADLAVTQASALIVLDDEALIAKADAQAIAWIATPQPRLLFAMAMHLFYQPYQPPAQIHPSAVIDPSAQLGKDVSIGAHVTIGPEATIGDGVQLYPNTAIYAQVAIGDRTIIHANCTIEERTQIGCDCIIHSGAVIGAEGFGFVPTAEGWYKMPQAGCVVLEDEVDVGCNSTIDRPAMGETRIKRQTKIDNQVHIGHNCTVGKGCAIAAQVGLAGQVEVGDRVILAGQVGVANQVKIGAGAIATAKSGLHKDVEPGAVVSGYPAVPNKTWLKNSAVYNRLPEMYRLFQHLQRRE